MYKETDKIYIKIVQNGYITELGMCGPIPNPIKVPVSTCMRMVKNGIAVYEVEPKTMQTCKLTLSNIFDDKKFGPKAVKKEDKVVQEAPVVEPVKPEIQFSGVSVTAPETTVEETSSKEETTAEETKDAEEQAPVQTNNRKKNGKRK